MPHSLTYSAHDWRMAAATSLPRRNPSARWSATTSSSRILASAAICLTIAAIAMAGAPACMHWFMVPVFLCGVLCGSDGLLLVSQKFRNSFQPVPLLGAFGVYYFFIAPIMHVATVFWFTSDPTWS